jgi:hypothetical protein
MMKGILVNICLKIVIKSWRRNPRLKSKINRSNLMSSVMRDLSLKALPKLMMTNHLFITQSKSN